MSNDLRDTVVTIVFVCFFPAVDKNKRFGGPTPIIYYCFHAQEVQELNFLPVPTLPSGTSAKNH